MSDHLEPWQQEPDPYWDDVRRLEREEWDLFVRRVEDDERERVEEHE